MSKMTKKTETKKTWDFSLNMEIVYNGVLGLSMVSHLCRNKGDSNLKIGTMTVKLSEIFLLKRLWPLGKIVFKNTVRFLRRSTALRARKLSKNPPNVQSYF